mgnify:CR=1 FL=1
MLPDPSSDRNREIKGPSRPAFEIDGATLRAPIEPLYHRHLLESYNQRCLAGVGRQGEIVLSPRRFSTQDRIAFETLSDFVAGDIAATIDFHGKAAERLGVAPRFLHHRVIRDSAYDEHHLFVELYDRDLRPVVANRGCLQIFSAGPVAHHYVLSDGCSVSEYRLVSSAAFREATDALCKGPTATPYHTWAYRWLLEAFRGATHLALAPDIDWKREIRDVSSLGQGLHSLAVLGGSEQPQFVADFEGQRYHMTLWLESRLSTPVCYRGPGRGV